MEDDDDAIVQQNPQTLDILGMASFVYTGQPPDQIPRDVTHVTIHPLVKMIEERAFQNCRHLVEVVFHDSLTTIGQSSFAQCSALEAVHLPNSVETIGQGAFMNCTSLKSVKLPDLLDIIRHGTFQGCQSLVSIQIPTFVDSIQADAFYNCSSLSEVELPEGIVSIRQGVFAYCQSLTKVRIPSTVTAIGACCFRKCTSLMEVELPRHLMTLHPNTFESCEFLKSIVLPETLETIRRAVFRNCYSLVSISIPSSVESIYNVAFSGCISLTHVRLHEGLKNIREQAFCNCKSLCGIALPTSLDCIEYGAFRNCQNLMGVEVPADTKRIRWYACFQQTALVNISLPTLSAGQSLYRTCFSLSPLGQEASNLLDRYSSLPVHQMCYHSMTSSVEDLELALKANDGIDAKLQDALGLTPFHLIATSVNPRADLLACLLNSYPTEILYHRATKKYKTMMDYLLQQTSSDFVPLIEMVLQQAIVVDAIRGLQWADTWGYHLSYRIMSITKERDKDARRKMVNEIMEYFGYCASMEMTWLIELALWKKKIADAVPMDGCEIIDREACRVQCQADVVLENVIGYLWNDDRNRTVLSSFSLSSLYSKE